MQALVTLNDPVYLEAAIALANLHVEMPYKKAIKNRNKLKNRTT